LRQFHSGQTRPRACKSDLGQVRLRTSETPDKCDPGQVRPRTSDRIPLSSSSPFQLLPYLPLLFRLTLPIPLRSSPFTPIPYLPFEIPSCPSPMTPPLLPFSFAFPLFQPLLRYVHSYPPISFSLLPSQIPSLSPLTQIRGFETQTTSTALGIFMGNIR
jgi:hypothetical protein